MYSFKILNDDSKLLFSLITDKDESKILLKHFLAKTIFSKTYGQIKTKGIYDDKIILGEKSFRNVFILDNHEINIERINTFEYQVDIFPLIKTNNFNFIFGCELETCILLDCLKNIKAQEYFKNIRQTDLTKENFIKENWLELVKIFIHEIIVKKASKKFRYKFPKIQIVLNPKSGMIDCEFDFVNNIFINKIEVINYDYLIFTRDSSIECSDTNYYLRDKERFHCEIITPIMSEIDDLSILYKNLFTNNCFLSNSSTGFHVNVSMITDNKMPIYWSKGLIDCFLNYFEHYEKINYNNFRPKGSVYAKKLLEHVKDYTYLNLQKNLAANNTKNKKSFKTFNDNFFKNKKYYRSFIDLKEKYNSFHVKNHIIAEFRLFPTKDDYKDLLEYVLDTYKLIKLSVEDYYENCETIIANLQTKNLEVALNYNSIEYYEGPLCYFDEDDELNKLDKKSYNEYNLFLEEGLKDLFHSRNQNMFKFEDNIAYVLLEGDDEVQKYEITLKNNFEVIVKLIS